MNGTTTYTTQAYDPLTASIITATTSSLSMLFLVLIAWLQKRLGVHVKTQRTKLEEVHCALKQMSASGSQNGDTPEIRV